MTQKSRKDIEELGQQVIGAAIEVHKELGPGLLESCYEKCLVQELRGLNISVEAQKTIPLFYKGTKIEEALRVDLLIEQQIILELKSVDKLNEIHMAQILTYLKLTKLNLGYLINFNVLLLKHGIKRVVNNL